MQAFVQSLLQSAMQTTLFRNAGLSALTDALGSEFRRANAQLQQAPMLQLAMHLLPFLACVLAVHFVFKHAVKLTWLAVKLLLAFVLYSWLYELLFASEAAGACPGGAFATDTCAGDSSAGRDPGPPAAAAQQDTLQALGNFLLALRPGSLFNSSYPAWGLVI